MKFITWCNSKANPLNTRLIQSAERYNINLEFVGDNHKVSIWDYGRWCGRWVWLKERLLELPSDEIVVVTDSYDVIYLTDETEITEKFFQLNKQIVASCERYDYHCFPSLKTEFPKLTNGIYKIPNPGACMGYVEYMLRACEWVINGNSILGPNPGDRDYSDMMLWNKFVYDNLSDVYLDDSCKIFMTESSNVNNDKNSAELENREAIIKHTNSSTRLKSYIGDELPCILHYTNPRNSSWGLQYIFDKFVIN